MSKNDSPGPRARIGLREISLSCYKGEKVLTPIRKISLGSCETKVKHGESSYKQEESAKKKQPLRVSFSGVFNKDVQEGIIEESGLLCLEFNYPNTPDGQIGDIGDLQQQLINDEHLSVAFSFKRYEANSLVLVVVRETQKIKHEELFDTLSAYLEDKYKIGGLIDKDCRNIQHVTTLDQDSKVYMPSGRTLQPCDVDFFLSPNAKPCERSELGSENEESAPRSQKAKPLSQKTVDRSIIPNGVYRELPDFLKRSVQFAESDNERDLLLLGTLCSASSALDMFQTNYLRKTYYPNLMIFIIAPAAAGKGLVNVCKGIVREIDWELRLSFQEVAKKFNAREEKKKGDSTVKEPVPKMHLLPGDSSAAGLFQVLDENEGRGLIFETEADTLTNSFKKEFSDYSVNFRNAAEHETISLYRKTEKETVSIENPRLSVLISGTPGQVKPLIKSSEDGLLSRLTFYHLPLKNEWKQPFDESDIDLREEFNELGKEFNTYYKSLRAGDPIKVRFTKQQGQTLSRYLEKKQNEYFKLGHSSKISAIRRMGVTLIRIAMNLTAIRQMEKEIPKDSIRCGEMDFKIAMTIVRTLIYHMEKVHDQVASARYKFGNEKQLTFFRELPTEFSREHMKAKSEELDVSIRTSEKWIKKFISDGHVKRVAHNNYKKTPVK